MTAQTPVRSAKMAAQRLGGKRSVNSGSSDSCSSAPKRRKVTVTAFEKWQKQFDKEHQTLSWLRCCKDQSNRSLVSTLFCDVCRLYEDKIEGMRNYSPVWVNGSANQKTSNIIDHAKSDQHAASLSYQRKAIAKATNQPVEGYAPIARCVYWLWMQHRR